MIEVRGKQIDTLYSESEIASAVERVAAEVAANSSNDLLVVSVLKGSFVFAADLIRALHLSLIHI